jgi:Fur family transcriptional regulator, ferric uptake regulator
MSCLETLKEKGLRLTPQRRLIADIFHDSHSHLTAEDIISFVQSKMPGVNKSTIYRTLDLLEQTGCVLKSESGDHIIYHHTEEGHHHHLVCRECGKSVDCHENLFYPVEVSLSQKYGFHVNFQHMVISGVCKECNSRAD